MCRSDYWIKCNKQDQDKADFIVFASVFCYIIILILNCWSDVVVTMVGVHGEDLFSQQLMKSIWDVSLSRNFTILQMKISSLHHVSCGSGAFWSDDTIVI